MKIAVLSGKGGTGKTTVAVSLASAGICQYMDCDVEEPNGAIFLKPHITGVSPVEVPVPTMDASRCDGCGRCAQVCQFHAISVVKEKVLLFPELCHHCGACAIACPRDAVSETNREIGVIEADPEDFFIQGRLHIGEPVTIPIIRALKKRMRDDVPVILDCPPGASCTVVASIRDCDYCVLVTEPTPFGLHDLKIAVELVRRLGLPFGAVVNKAMDGDQSIQEYCRENGITVLMEIPFSREIAEGYSRGILPVQAGDEWRDRFVSLYQAIERGAAL
jgi:MinD superfamily P-loop ATPase